MIGRFLVGPSSLVSGMCLYDSQDMYISCGIAPPFLSVLFYSSPVITKVGYFVIGDSVSQFLGISIHGASAFIR